VNWKNRELWNKQKRNSGAPTVAKRLYSIAAGTPHTVITHASNDIGHIICQHVLRTPNKGVMGVPVKETWYNGAAHRLQVVAVTITNPFHLSSNSPGSIPNQYSNLQHLQLEI